MSYQNKNKNKKILNDIVNELALEEYNTLMRMQRTSDRYEKWMDGMAEGQEEIIILLKDIRELLKPVAFHLTVDAAKENDSDG